MVQRVKSPYPTIRDPTYDRILRALFAALLSDRDAAVAPLLTLDGSRTALKATDNDLKVASRWEMEQILTLDDFLTNYNVSLVL